VSGDCLAGLLALPVVERIRLPSIAYLEPSDWLSAAAEEIVLDPQPGEPIGVLDDAIGQHPLLEGLVASRRSFPADHAWAPPGGHGTMVGGLALFGEFETALRERTPLRPQGLIHQARVLEAHPQIPRATRFAPGVTAHQAVEDAIETLHNEEGVRVFNLSINDSDPYSGPHVGLLTQRIDELIRELGIVVVVSAGNHRADRRNGRMDSGHDAAEAYPLYLLHPAARIAEPAPAALALTVGSLARFDAPQTLAGVARVGDRAVASGGEVSPFSRTGPGAFKGVKPDLVEVGGNWVITDTNTLDDENPGVGVISLGTSVTGRLFAVSTGTSFAAPRVARLAARIWHAYPEASANLVRALVAIACRAPEAARRQFPDAGERLRALGYGQPRAELALASGGPRVVMVFDGDIATDCAAIHPVPMPEVFTRGQAERRIAVALAYDPPVRRQRREYLAGEMSFDLLRNVTLEDVRARYERQGERRLPLYTGQREKLELEPGVQATSHSTLQLRHYRAQQLDPDDGDVYYLAVSHRSAPWAEEGDQRYAVAVELQEHARQEVDLYAAVLQQARVRARVRLRG
jgi:Subtilase family